MCVCVCVCVREWGGGERVREREILKSRGSLPACRQNEQTKKRNYLKHTLRHFFKYPCGHEVQEALSIKAWSMNWYGILHEQNDTNLYFTKINELQWTESDERERQTVRERENTKQINKQKQQEMCLYERSVNNC